MLTRLIKVSENTYQILNSLKTPEQPAFNDVIVGLLDADLVLSYFGQKVKK
jgi:predicted CopG family antitoxin